MVAVYPHAIVAPTIALLKSVARPTFERRIDTFCEALPR